MAKLFAQGFFQRLKATLVFRWRAYGDADPFAELIASHWAHDHAASLHRFKNALAIADAHEEEIRGGRDEFQPQCAELLGEESQAFGIVRARFADVLDI